MPETPPDKLMGWLTREEEEFGVTATIERTMDFEACRSLLEKELRYDISPEQVELMYATARYRYEAMPQIAVTPGIYTRPWGTQVTYRDIPTGRFIGREAVEMRLRDIGWYY